MYFHAFSGDFPLSCCTMAKPGLVYGTMGRIEPLLEPSILPRFLDLDQDGKTMAEYVWIGGSGSDLRSKTRVLTKEVKSVKDLPIWNYDGSSTGQAPGAHPARASALPAPYLRACEPALAHWHQHPRDNRVYQQVGAWPVVSRDLARHVSISCCAAWQG